MGSDDQDSDSDDNLPKGFGKDELTTAVRFPSQVRALLNQGHAVTEDNIRMAFAHHAVETLQMFLDTGTAFDMRSRACQAPEAQVERGWADGDVTPLFATEHDFRFSFRRKRRDDWYAIQHAAYLKTQKPESRDGQTAIMKALLDRQSNLFAVYPQQLAPRRIHPFPGEKKKFPADKGFFLEQEPSYGLRSALHSMLEDAARSDPILNHPDIDVDLETRDPQGRTLFLSACRNSVGADARLDATQQDASMYADEWRIKPFSTTKDSPSLFDALLARGADPLAVDKNGKNAIHHLLESIDPDSTRPTSISNSLHHLLRSYPVLVNQKDRHGTYPIHSALQRLRRYPLRLGRYDFTGLDHVVEDLLAAGANPLTRDGRGNTCLHYCADDGLTEEILSDHIRSLFRRFLASGIDINVRNHAGVTALEIVLKASTQMAEDRTYFHDDLLDEPGRQTGEQIDTEVFGWFKEAGAKWTERDPSGGTLLHLIAKHNRKRRGPSRAIMLIDNGVNIDAKDSNGKTALDIAESDQNKAMIETLLKKKAESMMMTKSGAA